jgi:site-specific DNA recombinase
MPKRELLYRHTIRRAAPEVTVLEGLQNHLMDPALCDVFCQEYTRHMNRLRGESNARHHVDRTALVKIERELDRLVQALMDGVLASRVKDKMTDLENRKAETEARIRDATDNPILIHPNMANYYRDQIATLREALGDEHAHVQAAEIIRKLVDRIVLTPVADEEGRTNLSIDLHGHLAGILSLATKAKRPLSESGTEMRYMKLVAGTRSHLDLLLTGLAYRQPCQGWGRGFESHRLLQYFKDLHRVRRSELSDG